jgi:hypothetical protein
LQSRIVFTFFNVITVYIFIFNIQKMYINLKAINNKGKKVLSILILLKTKLFKYYFNNNIDFEVLFGINKKTGLSYIND